MVYITILISTHFSNGKYRRHFSFEKCMHIIKNIIYKTRTVQCQVVLRNIYSIIVWYSNWVAQVYTVQKTCVKFLWWYARIFKRKMPEAFSKLKCHQRFPFEKCMHIIIGRYETVVWPQELWNFPCMITYAFVFIDVFAINLFGVITYQVI